MNGIWINYFISGGNQRDLARAKNAKKNAEGGKKKTADEKVIYL